MHVKGFPGRGNRCLELVTNVLRRFLSLVFTMLQMMRLRPRAAEQLAQEYNSSCKRANSDPQLLTLKVNVLHHLNSQVPQLNPHAPTSGLFQLTLNWSLSIYIYLLPHPQSKPTSSFILKMARVMFLIQKSINALPHLQ